MGERLLFRVQAFFLKILVLEKFNLDQIGWVNPSGPLLQKGELMSPDKEGLEVAALEFVVYGQS